jgi:hypothetical protein
MRVLILLLAMGCPKAPAPSTPAAAPVAADPLTVESDAALSARCQEGMEAAACRVLGLRYHTALLEACSQGGTGACELLHTQSNPTGGASRPQEAQAAYDKACTAGQEPACEAAKRLRAPRAAANPACSGLSVRVYIAKEGVELRGAERLLGGDKAAKLPCAGASGCISVGAMDWAAYTARLGTIRSACPDLRSIGLSASPTTPFDLVVEAVGRARGTAEAPLFPLVELGSP